MAEHTWTYDEREWEANEDGIFPPESIDGNPTIDVLEKMGWATGAEILNLATALQAERDKVSKLRKVLMEIVGVCESKDKMVNRLAVSHAAARTALKEVSDEA